MSHLELKVPPPVVALLTVVAMGLLSFVLPRIAVAAAPRIAVALAITLTALAFNIAGGIAFRRARTTVNPMAPGKTSSLVTSGVYRITRNPMYVGLLLLLLAWAVFLASPLALAGPVAFIAYLNRFQIQPEERVLAALFGSTYTDYQARVRRWL